MPAWSIRKWYLDCVAEDGTTWIGYWVDLRWSAMRIPVVSSFLYADSRFSARNEFRAEAPPELVDGDLHWSSPSLGVRVRMSAAAGGSAHQLHEGVTWRCVMGAAETRVELPDRTLRGVGYAEVLEMSVAPWRLPLRELYWGRAASRDTSLVWIRWHGEKPLLLVLCNGVLQPAVSIEDDEVCLANGSRVQMSERVVLREETLAKTLRAPRGIAALLPRALTDAVERKWRSRGTVFGGDGPTDAGWVIHERVTFA